MNDEEVLDDIRRVADKLDKTPSVHEFQDQVDYSYGVPIHRFGSWTEAVRGAGLSPNTPSPPAPPNEQIVEDIRRIADELDKTPTRAEFTEFADYHWHTVFNRFGSWTDAIRAAGLNV